MIELCKHIDQDNNYNMNKKIQHKDKVQYIEIIMKDKLDKNQEKSQNKI